MTDPLHILAVNCGSSSVKIALVRVEQDEATSLVHWHLDTALDRDEPPASQQLTSLLAPWRDQVQAVVHRVVHGGRELPLCGPVTDHTLAVLRDLIPLAPLHNPLAIRWIEACRSLLAVPQVMVCDTGFFRELPAIARHYGLPAALAAQHGLLRYGFHGTAHQCMLAHWCEQEPALARRHRIITLQLGSGCSAAAIRDGAPIDTTMGFSPGEGLLMATRCGDLDVEAALYLMGHQGLDAAQLSHLLQTQSGLLGVSGRSGDVRDLLADSGESAQLALDLFCYRIRKTIGAYAAALGGLDGILLGGGIGEHQPAIRQRILGDLQWLGVRMDWLRNDSLARGAGAIHGDGSDVRVHVVAVDENLAIARHAWQWLAADGD